MYKVGTRKDAEAIRGKVPDEVYREIFHIADILESVYGKDRDIDKDDGGFILVAEDREDLKYFSNRYIDLKKGLHEVSQAIPSSEGVYLNLLFLCNNEYGINLFAPAFWVSEFFPVAKRLPGGS